MKTINFLREESSYFAVYIHISAINKLCLSVSLYPMNVKTPKPIEPNIF